MFHADALHKEWRAYRLPAFKAGCLEHNSEGPIAHHTLGRVVDSLLAGAAPSHSADDVPTLIGVTLDDLPLKHLQQIRACQGLHVRQGPAQHLHALPALPTSKMLGCISELLTPFCRESVS